MGTVWRFALLSPGWPRRSGGQPSANGDCPLPAELNVGCGFVRAAEPRAVAAQIGQIPAQSVEVELFGRKLTPSEFGVALMSARHPEVACRRREPNGVPVDHDRPIASDQDVVDLRFAVGDHPARVIGCQ